MHNQWKGPRTPSASRATLLHSTTGSTFELGRAVGGGGMGHVYLAQQHREGEQPGQLVALKLLRLNAPEQARRLFYHEGTLLPRLQNPHIVRHIESGRGAVAGIGAVDYLALGYIAGSTTEELLKHQSPLPPATALGIVAQIATALTYLHQRGVIHCDLKPSNIMLEHATPRAVLIDFGIARAPDFLGQPVAVGTPQYMAPEQADARVTCDGRADIYALGVVIYELLTGRRLFSRRTTADIRRGHLVSVSANDLAGTIEPALAHVIARCLQHNPHDRYSTVEELLEDMQRALVMLDCIAPQT